MYNNNLIFSRFHFVKFISLNINLIASEDNQIKTPDIHEFNFECLIATEIFIKMNAIFLYRT